VVICAKRAEPIEMPFGLWAQMGVQRCWGTLPWQPVLGHNVL